jgi:cytochrome P450
MTHVRIVGMHIDTYRPSEDDELSYLRSLLPFYLINVDTCIRYLQQVVNETLRCAAVGPFAAREQEVDTVIGGHRIPAWVSSSWTRCTKCVRAFL